MALRIVKRRVSSMDGLGVATEVASFVKDISNMAQFAPVAVAATLILRILELLQVPVLLLFLDLGSTDNSLYSSSRCCYRLSKQTKSNVSNWLDAQPNYC